MNTQLLMCAPGVVVSGGVVASAAAPTAWEKSARGRHEAPATVLRGGVYVQQPVITPRTADDNSIAPSAQELMHLTT
ncbi:hypothetical protein [Umezawaea beigongshangensis]|uniref:hypothetical protein n=1 Tax=Umezawaea beigongshangensis TaxID=2780383 RepID=UPI0018F26C08|nr:hypothetical protein [Umezawaea beigongshangensis]